MKRIFNIKVTIWSKWRIFFIFFIVSGLCTYMYNCFFTGRPNAYHIVKVLGGLIVLSFLFLYKKLLYPLRIEIDESHISLYKKNKLFYKNSKDNLHKVRILKNARDEIVEVKLCFEDRHVVLYSPIKMQLKGRNVDSIEDVFHYLVKFYSLKQTKVYGRVLGFGKKFENKLINEYWNEKYLTTVN